METENLERAEDVTRESSPKKIVAGLVLGFFFLIFFAVVGLFYYFKQLASRGLEQASKEIVETVVDQLDNPLRSPKAQLQLPFGEQAKQECILHCYQSAVDRADCLSNCERLVVEQYPRRLQAEEFEPAQTSQQIVRLCADSEVKTVGLVNSQTTSPTSIEAIRASAMQRPLKVAIYEQAAAIKAYADLVAQRSSFASLRRVEPIESEDLRDLDRLLCLEQAIASTQLAIAEISPSYDLFSEQFYLKLETLLIVEVEARRSRSKT